MTGESGPAAPAAIPSIALNDENTIPALGLGVAEKPDSQDICFVPSGGYADVVGRLRPDALEPGEIVTVDGGLSQR